MDNESKARIARIHETVRIDDLLFQYGYHVRPDAGDREQQFSCDMHGSGNDLKPSARVYPHTHTWYCFGCGKSRDAIETTKEKEGLTFWQAVRHLEKKYNLPTVNWTPKEDSGDVFLREQEQQLRRTRSYEAELKRIDAFLSMLTEDKILPMDKVLGLWEARDKINFLHLLAAVKIDERSAKTVLGKVLRSAQEAVEDLA